MDKTTPHPETSRLITDLGGTVKLADECDVTPSAVSQWKTEGIPHPRYQFLRLKYPKANWDGVKVSRKN
ncbi:MULTISPECIES: Cro/CI family transcriptional regulator [Ralstonia]|jgi:hypothetical protein|uniref:Cro/CI family transcriptional regulator n=1 Tax=Ralstonia TaxID=48736 RepID=UPI000A3DC5F9|nr:hypothetical protein [Ralstonia pickettii]